MSTMHRNLFNLILRLVPSRWSRRVAEHHSPFEESVTARIGPIRLETNHCFVLDHADARVTVQIGKLAAGYVACVGSEAVRQSGPVITWNGRSLRQRQNQMPDVPF